MKKSFFDSLMASAQSDNKISYYCLQGVHHQFSYNEFWNLVKLCSFGLQSFGIKKEQSVGIMSSSNVYWLIMDLAVLSLGGRSVALAEDLSQENLLYQINDARIKFLYVEGQEQYDKIKKHRDLFVHIITKDVDKSQTSLANLIEQGKKYSKQTEKKINLDENSISSIIYTSGSTAEPKGVCLALKHFSFQLEGIKELFPLKQEDRALSCLPLNHIFERVVVYYYLSCGVAITFINVKEVSKYIKLVRPTLMTMVPRILEKIYLAVREKVDKKPFFARQIGRWVIGRTIKKQLQEKNCWEKVLFALFYKKIYQNLGGDLKMIVSGGAALNSNISNFFSHISIPIYQGYGLTELACVVASNCPSNNKVGTVGRLFPNVKVKFDKNNQILIQSPSLMIGYYNQNKETAKVIKENYFYSGDLGKIDEQGYLTITGRDKELFKTSTGKYVSPTKIESLLMQTNLISYAMIIADNRNFTSCLLFVEEQNYFSLSNRTKLNKNLSWQDFYQNGFADKIFAKVMKEVNNQLNKAEQIIKYKIICDPLSIQTGELSTKMQIRRHILEKKYKKIIANFYQ